MKILTTYHKSKCHSAVCHKTGASLGPVPTEIDLSRLIRHEGINLTKLKGESQGADDQGHENVIHWFLA